ncbi:histone-like nucleoid-structuring protein Lsr2 [Streptomyces sp. ICN441]|uniref:Lsr2 family DNA-binding protein n=1 Tax=Streptomyces sp. ICN441 TaxID=2558286 RepID=UPI00141B7DE1|nr:histone-like nucleoid-structuring protein Lsr2 [Streptomyces sp. ICN441]
MTIAALRALLEEEQPDVRRHPAPWIPHTAHRHKETTVSVTIPPRPESAIPIGQLLAWAAAHQDKRIRDHAERARASLAALRERHQADEELAELDLQESELQKRLDAVRSRKAELLPAKKTGRDYDPKEVRAWAHERGLTVPDRGQIPKAVLAAWRERDGMPS